MGTGVETSAATAASSTSNLALYSQMFSSVVNSYSAYTRAQAEQAALNHQAQIAANNAQTANELAADALNRGVTAKLQQQLRTRQLAGTQRASMAARGLDISDGSALDILTTTEFMGQVDANTVSDNAAREAWGFRNQSANYAANSANLRMRSDSISPFAEGASTLLTSAGRVASTWYGTRDKANNSRNRDSTYLDIPQ